MRAKVILLSLAEFCLLFVVNYEVGVLLGRPDTGEGLLWGIGRAFAPAAIFTIVFYYNDLYNLRIVRNFATFFSHLPWALTVSFALLAILYKCFPTLAVNGRPLFSSVLDVLVAATVVVVIRWAFYVVLKIRQFAERVLILGSGQLAHTIAEEIEATPHSGYSIVGFVDDSGMTVTKAQLPPRYPLYGPLERLDHILAEVNPDRIIVALAERRGRLPVRSLLNARMTGVIVEDGIGVHERFSGKLAIESLTPSYLIYSKDFTRPKIQAAARRVGNLAFAAIGLILAAPLMLVIAIAIKLDSKGPVFFIQDRAGLEGRLFRLVKFRTMHPASSEEETEAVWNRDVNSRVTRVGKWLRHLRLDELPQFINILRGDMDLVGPRPEMAGNIQTMTEQIPYYALRMAVRPGITGWAQVRHSYSVSQEDVTEKMRYDLYYVKHMSLLFDVRILIDTVKTVLLGCGSAIPTSAAKDDTQEKVSERHLRLLHSNPAVPKYSEKS